MPDSHFEWSAKKVSAMPLSERMASFPTALRDVLLRLIAQVDPFRIWVYGSRARGDHGSLSDYDMAVELGPVERSKWLRFKIKEEDATRMLLPIDWLLFDDASPDFRQKINEEGVLLYEKTR